MKQNNCHQTSLEDEQTSLQENSMNAYFQNVELSSKGFYFLRTMESLFELSHGINAYLYRGFEYDEDFPQFEGEVHDGLIDEWYGMAEKEGHHDCASGCLQPTSVNMNNQMSDIDCIYFLHDIWMQFRIQFLQTTKGLPYHRSLCH